MKVIIVRGHPLPRVLRRIPYSMRPRLGDRVMLVKAGPGLRKRDEKRLGYGVVCRVTREMRTYDVDTGGVVSYKESAQ